MMDHDLLQDQRRTFTALVEMERNEQDKENGGWVVFDGFSKNSPYSDMHTRNKLDLLALRVPFASIVQRFANVAEFAGLWVEIEVGTQKTADSVLAEVVMFGDNAESVFVNILNIWSTALSLHERQLFTLSNQPRAPASLIAGVLDISLRNSGNLAIAAYDVGQGNCNAIVDKHEHPRVFFDLGWAPNFHARTRPPSQPSFFCCDEHTVAPVVLSHWDMDHWCYAIARSNYNSANLTTNHEWNPEALKRFWIARVPQVRQHNIGPLALSFYQALAATRLMPGVSAILLWPKHCKRISFEDGWLEACEPSPLQEMDRNNTGIAMFVRPNGTGPTILMTGDADFPSIPSLVEKRRLNLVGMIAPHHGSRITGTEVPKPLRSGQKRLVLSVGIDNSYGHPKQESIDAYEAASRDWTVILTQDRQQCTNTHPHVHNHGNILLKFSSDTPDPQCGCGRVRAGNLCLIPSSVPMSAPVAGIKKPRRKKIKAVKTP